MELNNTIKRFKKFITSKANKSGFKVSFNNLYIDDNKAYFKHDKTQFEIYSTGKVYASWFNNHTVSFDI